MKIFGPKLNKTASLQLSINAIVILILAITILGLGLGFIKKQFSSLGEQFEAVSSEIKGEIIEKIRQSGDLLVFNRVEIEATIGKPDTFYVGVKNTGGETTCFRTHIQCKKALQGECDPSQPGVPITVGGISFNGDEAFPGSEWFKLFKEVDIDGGDVGVFPLTIQIPGRVNPDTYLMSYEVFKANTDCEGGDFGTVATPYQSKQFYINVR
jgi:hypothetical protein